MTRDETTDTSDLWDKLACQSWCSSRCASRAPKWVPWTFFLWDRLYSSINKCPEDYIQQKMYEGRVDKNCQDGLIRFPASPTILSIDVHLLLHNAYSKTKQVPTVMRILSGQRPWADQASLNQTCHVMWPGQEITSDSMRSCDAQISRRSDIFQRKGKLERQL